VLREVPEEIQAWYRRERFAFVDVFGARVYFIWADPPGLIKIGTARDVTQRLQSLTTMSPVPLRLLGTLPGGQRVESRLHARFGEARRHGEWFEPAPSLLRWLRDCGLDVPGQHSLPGMAIDLSTLQTPPEGTLDRLLGEHAAVQIAVPLTMVARWLDTSEEIASEWLRAERIPGKQLSKRTRITSVAALRQRERTVAR